MTTDLHPHIGQGVLAHDPDRLLGTILTAIEQVCFHAGIDRVHPNKGEGFTNLISPRTPAFAEYAAQWWGTDKNAWDRGTATHVHRVLKRWGGFEEIVVQETPGSHVVQVDCFSPSTYARTHEREFETLVTSLEPAGMRINAYYRYGINWQELKDSILTWTDIARTPCGEVKRWRPGQIPQP